MSYVLAAPGMMAAAAADVAAVGSAVSAAHLAAAVPTVSVIPAAADEVSASVAQVFSGAAQEFHALAAKAAAFGEQFVQHLTTAAGSYVAAEAASTASLLQSTASAGSAASVIPNLPSQLFSAVTGPLTLLSTFVAEFRALASLAYFDSYLGLVVAYELSVLVEQLLKSVLPSFGVPIPF
ncbi:MULTISPECIES: PE family protein [unclassified Mycobacterium]|uniref:PE family protein n=1 Tax=unclassified Mycobacterium TaxID=2642494 RepID=UPI0007FC676C|nr:MULTISPECIES: PE family protein [unclassified Mycobacterium]OBH02034.1 hypothetical protein A5696_12460 [Mycobacterium sp. E2699]OBI49177.1 hypothetical protein A5705_13930 [Mycobacterium sp. E787]